MAFCLGQAPHEYIEQLLYKSNNEDLGRLYYVFCNNVGYRYCFCLEFNIKLICYNLFSKYVFFLQIILSPPAYEVRREVIFSVCLSVHTQVQGGGEPISIPEYFHWSDVLSGVEILHLHPIIFPLVPCPFWGYTSDWSQMGVPQSQTGNTPSWGTPSLPGQDGVPLARSRWGTPQPGQNGVPPSQVRTGYPLARTWVPLPGQVTLG